MSERAKAGALILGAEPRANLLPPEVHNRARLRRIRRTLAMLVILAVLIVVAGYGGASLRATAAQTALDTSTATTAQILIETQKYSPVKVVADQSALIEAAQATATANEVLWPELVADIVNVLPASVAVTDLNLTVPAPGVTVQATTGPLDPAHVGTAILTLNAGSLAQVAAAVADLSRVPGYADASLTSVNTSANNAYTAMVTLDLGTKALSGRFTTDASGVKP